MKKTAHDLLVIRLLELGKKLDQRYHNTQMVSLWDRGDSWKKTEDDDADDEIFALQAEVAAMIADSDSDLFPSGPSGRVSGLVLRIMAVVSYRLLFSEWSYLSLVDLAQAVAEGEGIPQQLASRRAVVSLCQQGVLRGICQGEVCPTISASAKLLAFLECGIPLIVPAPKPAPRAEKPSQSEPTKSKPDKTQ